MVLIKIEEMSDKNRHQFLKTYLGTGRGGDKCHPNSFVRNNSFQVHTGSSVHTADHVMEACKG